MDASLLTTWWVWVAAALMLASLEIFLPGYIFLGFAVAAALTGVVSIAVPMPLQIMMTVFAILSLVSWFAMRKIFRTPGQTAKRFDHDINDN
ncbi:MAG: hypothetical protein JXR13_08210 [Thalassovita sp.]